MLCRMHLISCFREKRIEFYGIDQDLLPKVHCFQWPGFPFRVIVVFSLHLHRTDRNRVDPGGGIHCNPGAAAALSVGDREEVARYRQNWVVVAPASWNYGSRRDSGSNHVICGWTFLGRGNCGRRVNRGVLDPSRVPDTAWRSPHQPVWTQSPATGEWSAGIPGRGPSLCDPFVRG